MKLLARKIDPVGDSFASHLKGERRDQARFIERHIRRAVLDLTPMLVELMAHLDPSSNIRQLSAVLRQGKEREWTDLHENKGVDAEAVPLAATL